jgi:ribosomal protein S18 acetylase RimI-like enzyme
MPHASDARLVADPSQGVPCHRVHPMTELRTLTPDDWPLWRELRLRALAEAPYAFASKLADWQGAGDRERRWRDRLLWGGSHNVVALLDGRPAGMASGVPAEQGSVELVSMWVAPEARAQGVGDAVVGDVARWATVTGADRLLLAVRADNARAVAFYRRLGFQDRGTLPRESEEEPLELRMEKELSHVTLSQRRR